jgi:hypothetical protein
MAVPGYIRYSMHKGGMPDMNPTLNINKMFILDTSVGQFYFDSYIEDEVVYIDDPRLEMDATFKNQVGMCDALNEHINKFINGPESIIVLDYSPNTAMCLKSLHEKFKQDSVGHLLFITFIHSDEDCKYLWFKNPEDAIWQKYEFINSFLLFPFINKIEIPFDHCITGEYINRLFRAAHSCPLLSEVPNEETEVPAAPKKKKKKGSGAK